jgi:hypothetical protein
MFIKIHKSYRNVVALADADLIGKKFEEGKFQLEVKENFYKDKKVSREEAIELLKLHKLDDATFNIVGPKSIKTAIDAEIIKKENIGKIQEIEFALTLL